MQRNLEVDIDNLESRLRFANIGLMPIVVAVIALIISVLRLRRRRARRVVV